MPPCNGWRKGSDDGKLTWQTRDEELYQWLMGWMMLLLFLDLDFCSDTLEFQVL